MSQTTAQALINQGAACHSVWWVEDGDNQHSCFIVASTMEDAGDQWDENLNPYGLEVQGHPWRDGAPLKISNIFSIEIDDGLDHLYAYSDEAEQLSELYPSVETAQAALKTYITNNL